MSKKYMPTIKEIDARDRVIAAMPKYLTKGQLADWEGFLDSFDDVIIHLIANYGHGSEGVSMAIGIVPWMITAWQAGRDQERERIKSLI